MKNGGTLQRDEGTGRPRDGRVAPRDVECDSLQAQQLLGSRDPDDAAAVGACLRKRQTDVRFLKLQHQSRGLALLVDVPSLSVHRRRRLLDQGIELAVTPRNHLKRHSSAPYECAGLR